MYSAPYQVHHCRCHQSCLHSILLQTRAVKACWEPLMKVLSDPQMVRTSSQLPSFGWPSFQQQDWRLHHSQSHSHFSSFVHAFCTSRLPWAYRSLYVIRSKFILCYWYNCIAWYTVCIITAKFVQSHQTNLPLGKGAPQKYLQLSFHPRNLLCQS